MAVNPNFIPAQSVSGEISDRNIAEVTGARKRYLKIQRESSDVATVNAQALAGAKEGYAHPNQYEVLILPPLRLIETPLNPSKNFIRGINYVDKKEISLRCESVTLPGRNLSSTGDANVHGPLREIVNNVN